MTSSLQQILLRFQSLENELVEWIEQSHQNDHRYKQAVEQIALLEASLGRANISMRTYEEKLQSLDKQHVSLQDEMAGLKKVSFVANLNKQIHEKNYTIESLQRRLDQLQLQYNQLKNTPPIAVSQPPVLEQEPVTEEMIDEVEEEAEEEPEVEYDVKKIGKKYYYVSNESPIGIYAVNKETNSVGDKVGEYSNDQKPLFYS